MLVRRAVVVTVLLLGGLATFSCTTFDLPSETCDPATLDAKRDPGSDDATCSRCLEDRCCDVVGRCQRQDTCAGLVHDAHKCVLDANLQGAREESKCAEKLAAAPFREADDAYRCMRGSCGAECGLPVCQVDKSALLIRNARCDACFSGACCAPLNSCYGNRACKLMIECIVSDCGSELGPALAAGGALVPDAGPRSASDIAAFCADPSAVPSPLPACVRTCLCRYRDNDQGLPPADPTLLPVNMAESVYTCGKEAECGDECTAGSDEAGAR